MNTYLAVLFGAAFIGAWIAFGLLMKRDRGTHADEMPQRPQRGDMEEESKKNRSK